MVETERWSNMLNEYPSGSNIDKHKNATSVDDYCYAMILQIISTMSANIYPQLKLSISQLF